MAIPYCSMLNLACCVWRSMIRRSLVEALNGDHRRCRDMAVISNCMSIVSFKRTGAATLDFSSAAAVHPFHQATSDTTFQAGMEAQPVRGRQADGARSEIGFGKRSLRTVGGSPDGKCRLGSVSTRL